MVRRRVVGSGTGDESLVLSAKSLVLAAGVVAPKLLRTSERSVRSIVGASSKLPLDQRVVASPKLLRTVERSERSTRPSPLASPGRSEAEGLKVRLSSAMPVPEPKGCPWFPPLKETEWIPGSERVQVLLGVLPSSWVTDWMRAAVDVEGGEGGVLVGDDGGVAGDGDGVGGGGGGGAGEEEGDGDGVVVGEEAGGGDAADAGGWAGGAGRSRGRRRGGGGEADAVGGEVLAGQVGVGGDGAAGAVAHGGDVYGGIVVEVDDDGGLWRGRRGRLWRGGAFR